MHEVSEKLQQATANEDHFTVGIGGKEYRFHFLWLRDNCPASRTRNGQRTHESTAIDPAIRPMSFSCDSSALTVTWHDGMRSSFPARFLARHIYDRPIKECGDVTLWDSQIVADIRHHTYDDLTATSAVRRSWLRDLREFGFCLAKNVPVVEDTIFDVVSLFGFVRETNYGRLFDVRVTEDANNLAYTAEPLSVHTDNPYRDPCPTLQLLHCLEPAQKGGVTALADGFFAAENLRGEHPQAFELLRSHDVLFHYENAEAVLEHRGPIINTGPSGQVIAIRINNRSMAPLDLPFDLTGPYYDALMKFRRILDSDATQFRLTLQAGDLLMLDNERVLHGRSGESIGPRHLQGCYADRDGAMSTLRLLEREQ